MKANLDRLLLLGLLAAWMLVAWPHLSEQFSTTERTRAVLADLSWEQRAAALDQPAYQVAADLAKAIPEQDCVVLLAYAGPEHLRYYRSRLAYYLYPRHMLFPDDPSLKNVNPEAAGKCEYLAVFRDTPQNLAQEPFHGHWDERLLAERTAGMNRVLANGPLEVYRAR
jgi:hypothetical protein